MSLEIKNDLGTIDISMDVIANIAGGIMSESYGVVGMASKTFRDGFAELLGKENYSRGVVVENESDKLKIDLYIIVLYGVKISEVASNVQSTVKYTLEKTLGLEIDSVNIHVQGVRVINSDE
ncbi:MAG TPA: Asp23/Gls24 family envelope stress response protein [Jeotgalicoccus sp.]|nr:Asp23/Gls24 family envelope stress response protein [Jeotgalicoccus sp.]